MLCGLCRAIDFSSSALQEQDAQTFIGFDQLPPDQRPTDLLTHYRSYPHHASVSNLCESSRDCMFCLQALTALQHIGLRPGAEGHEGPIEIRWYPHIPRMFRGTLYRELHVVAKLEVRKMSTAFYLVEYLGVSQDVHRSLGHLEVDGMRTDGHLQNPSQTSLHQSPYGMRR